MRSLRRYPPAAIKNSATVGALCAAQYVAAVVLILVAMVSPDQDRPDIVIAPVQDRLWIDLVLAPVGRLSGNYPNAREIIPTLSKIVTFSSYNYPVDGLDR